MYKVVKADLSNLKDGNALRIDALVLAQQKGSDPEECRERVLGAEKHFKLLRKFSDNVRLMIVGGANGGVAPEVVASWLDAETLPYTVINNIAGNTREKGEQIANYIKVNGISIVHQYTSAYHTLRAYLTTKKALNDSSLSNVSLYGYACDLSGEPLSQLIVHQLYTARSRFHAAHAMPLILESVQNILDTSLVPNLEKYLKYGEGEARRLIEYGTREKADLDLNIDLVQVTSSFPQINTIKL